jgi:hypothetical protein
VDNLAKIAETVREFATSATLTLVPAAPVHDYGPEVCLGPDIIDLPAFLALAQHHGGGLLYLGAAPFDPEANKGSDGESETPPEMTRYKGRVGEVSVAFAANGVVHFWEHQTPWYRQWRDTVQAAGQSWRRTLDDEDESERLSPEEHDRRVNDLAATLLANPEFRGAKLGGARHRFAELAVPPDTDRAVKWDAIRKASERAEELARTTYAALADRLDELAAQLITTEPWRRASSPGALKQAAEQFLIPLADGFCPPALVRDELYAKAKAQAKTTRNPTGLF